MPDVLVHLDGLAFDGPALDGLAEAFDAGSQDARILARAAGPALDAWPPMERGARPVSLADWMRRAAEVSDQLEPGAGELAERIAVLRAAGMTCREIAAEIGATRRDVARMIAG